jgi:hypothetical protein
VKQIVNQPVEALTRPAGADVAAFGPGWFHPGAMTPNFANPSFDVRRTQELPYARFTYVTSDISPNVMYRGADLEFNAMTKYFYTDRSVPKKRLSEAEMLEINDLYHVIGRTERQLARLHGPAAAPPADGGAAAAEPSRVVPLVAGGGAVLLLGSLLILRARRS